MKTREKREKKTIVVNHVAKANGANLWYNFAEINEEKNE